MRRKILIGLILLAASGCGGGEDSGNVVKLVPSYPEKLSQFADSLAATAVVKTSGGNGAVISEPAEGVFEEDAWRFEIATLADIPESGAVIHFEFERADQSAQEKETVQGGQGLLLATVDVPIESLDDTTELSPDSGDYNLSADDDSDGLANVDELLFSTNPKNADTDGDGAKDGQDIFPSIAAEWLDTDGDGVGDNSDDDIDGDGLSNDEELILGTDKFRADTDGDNVGDSADICPTMDDPFQIDTDGDGRGDACDDDSDGDGLSDAVEVRYGTDKLKPDTDGDGVGDGTEVENSSDPLKPDTDGDGAGDKNDNCVNLANTDQRDNDRDNLGDACDSDLDGDGRTNQNDNCPEIVNQYQDDSDGDGQGDLCDADADGDGRPNATDNCPNTANPEQKTEDKDSDGVAVECDLDDDDEFIGTDTDAIFVDMAHGFDSSRGTRALPVATIAEAVSRSRGKNLPILVAAGEYDISNVVIFDDTRIYGGFAQGVASERFRSREVLSADAKYLTILTRADVAKTLVIAAENPVIDGFHIVNRAAVFDEVNPSTAVEIISGRAAIARNVISGNAASPNSAGLIARGGEPDVVHNRIDGGSFDALGSESAGVAAFGGGAKIRDNIITAGGGRFATGIEISSAEPKIENNTIDAASGNEFVGTSYGIRFHDSSPVVLGNLVFTDNAPDGIPIVCSGTPPGPQSEIENNVFVRMRTESGDTIARDCDGIGYDSADFSMGGAVVRDNEAFAGDAPAEIVSRRGSWPAGALR